MYTEGLLSSLTRVRKARTLRSSSFDRTGRNRDAVTVPPGETFVMADLKGPGCIRHIWMTQQRGYRDVVLKMFWDGSDHPSVLCPLGDFFGLGHEIVNSYQSLLFTASTRANNQFNAGCALNCYAQMPFRKSARIEIENQGDVPHGQYFYVDYEIYDEPLPEDVGLFHAHFRRQNPFPGWAHEIRVNTSDVNIVNKGRTAWRNNYVILDATGAGHYVGCNLSVTNFQGTWWGEGDDMIWVDGYKWPPDLHGTGSEDYLNQAWGMQPNAFLRNGSSIYESHTNGYQTSYVHHLENPVRFQKEIKVTIEHGHGNHLCNEMSSVAYWYQAGPAAGLTIPARAQRKPVKRDNFGEWLYDKKNQIRSKPIEITAEMKRVKKRWAKKQG